MDMHQSAGKWSPLVLSVVRICVGLLFFQHGAEKLWGFANGRMVGYNFTSLIGIAGPIEVVGGLLLVLGLFTRTTAFILCGEMAVAYFTAWAPRGFWPINNGGEEAALFCWIFLWLFTAGAGPWSLDGLLHRAAKPTKQAIDAWEGYGRSLLRLVVAFMFSLHGYRHLFGVFPRVAGRRGAVPMALDALPSVCGVLEIAGGLLLLIGLFTRPTALVLCCELLVAYFYSALPRAIWPVRNGGDEVLLYLLVFLYLATSGAGAWSWDDFLKKNRTGLVTANAVRTT